MYEGKGQYLQTDLGGADDNLQSNGKTVLTFYEAQEHARVWAAEQLRALQLGAPLDLTVCEAVESYLKWYESHRKALNATEATVKAHILPKLGDVVIRELTSKQIRDWHHGLAAKPRRRRTKIGKGQQHGEKPTTEDEKRARRATANRILTILKATLNRAFHDELVPDDTAWRKVKPFKGADEPVIRYLTPSESTLLVNACPLPFKELVAAALHTGARYSELVSLNVADFNRQSETIYFRPSKSARSRHVPLTAEGTALFARLCTGKAGDAKIFAREDGTPWGKNHQVRPITVACKTAKK